MALTKEDEIVIVEKMEINDVYEINSDKYVFIPKDLDGKSESK